MAWSSQEILLTLQNLLKSLHVLLHDNFDMPLRITCASALPDKTQKHENRIFHSIGLCYTHNAPVCHLPERKMLSVMCLIASNICWGSNIIPLILSIDFYSRLYEERLPSFTQRLTVWQTWLTQSMWVTHSRMLCSLPRSCLVLQLDRFDSERWFSSDQVIFLTVFRVFWWKSMQHLSEKTQFPGFLFPQVVQKH